MPTRLRCVDGLLYRLWAVLAWSKPGGVLGRPNPGVAVTSPREIAGLISVATTVANMTTTVNLEPSRALLTSLQFTFQRRTPAAFLFHPAKPASVGEWRVRDGLSADAPQFPHRHSPPDVASRRGGAESFRELRGCGDPLRTA